MGLPSCQREKCVMAPLCALGTPESEAVAGTVLPYADNTLLRENHRTRDPEPGVVKFF